MLLEQFRPESAVPAVGTARDREGSTILWLTIDERASRAFKVMTEQVPDCPVPGRDPSVWLERGGAMLEPVAPLLVRSLRCASFLGCPVVVVRGLRVGRAVPATPYDGVVDPVASHAAIVNLHAVVASLGLHPVAYAKENTSTLHAVCPVTGARGRLSSHGFDAALPFHTDYADRPIDEPVEDQSPAASFLAFAVERAEAEIPMEFAATRHLLAALTPAQIRVGRTETFAVRAPDIFGGGVTPRVRRLFSADGSRCRLNLATMTGVTERASRLLRDIREILADASMVEKIHVRRGDIVVMDNQRAIHRRAAFAPRWDGTDRYFIRMSTVRDPGVGLADDPRRPWIWSK